MITSFSSQHHREETEMIQAHVSAKNEGWVFTAAILLGAFGLYVLALDQGFLLSLIQGAQAFDMNLIHEALHDARHVAAFPCH
jgi:hypothetical protein